MLIHLFAVQVSRLQITGYWQGLDQVIIRDYMAADSLQPHFGAGKMPLVAIVRACTCHAS